ncbi:uncharacterized protein LOC108205745 isoform X1 [Daucus carota subsp. sativus]|uniref:uncharacterized protein LOC108205745 isoform X1 n=1 Tax=Daucus carota subsp. sativus TaxID=79200 RepID=UPI0007EF0951|nr:PREDICTED: uncharacterized protein LOC108205745 isoform X1 [Daucus carota subsp. sativus]
MGGGREVEVVNSKGCSRLLVNSISPSVRLVGVQMSHDSASVSTSSTHPHAPFSGLVICVTGLSKDGRKQVMDVTRRLGGKYSSDLHPKCTHLIVQSCHGLKYEHALKYGSKNGLFIVTLGWFMDSVRRNVRLDESLYGVKNVGENGILRDDSNGLSRYANTENYCIPVGMLEHFKQSDTINQLDVRSTVRDSNRSMDLILSGSSLFIDTDVPAELQNKIAEAATLQGAKLVNHWIGGGRNASHVVCEGTSVGKYIGHSDNLVTPLWVLKTAKEKRVPRLVHISVDLARQLGTILENVQSGLAVEERNKDTCSSDALKSGTKVSHEARQNMANLAKSGVRKRRVRRMQRCQTPIRPITPNRLLESVCWSVSEPTCAAAIYTESSGFENAGQDHASVFYNANVDEKESIASFVNFTRKLTESEKGAVIFKNHFLTILFPVDRFAEMGPCSRSFFSDSGFTCLQVLDYIYAFYQENMSKEEVELAIHTDSVHADRLRSMYSSKETAEHGYMEFKRIDFLGSRKSFEMLKRVPGDDNSNVYELLIKA